MSGGGNVWNVIEWIWDRKETIGRKLKGIYDWFRGGRDKSKRPGILILGPGGVGKTTLGKLLSGQYDLLFDLPGVYEESLNIETYALKDTPNVEIVVPPGQSHRREATWADLHSDIASGKFRGIIVLAAYGYHSLGQLSFKQDKRYEGDKKKYLQTLLESSRNDELSVLRQLLPHVKACRSRLWLLTLVAKRDLWWPKRSEVEAFYRSGEYGAELNRLTDQMDSLRFRHELLFASLVISNFVTGMGERLAPNATGYDHQLHALSLRRMFETIEALKSWEELQ